MSEMICVAFDRSLLNGENGKIPRGVVTHPMEWQDGPPATLAVPKCDGAKKLMRSPDQRTHSPLSSAYFHLQVSRPPPPVFGLIFSGESGLRVMTILRAQSRIRVFERTGLKSGLVGVKFDLPRGGVSESER